MLSSDELWQLWRAAFYWEDWAAAGPDRRSYTDDGIIIWSIKRFEQANTSEICLYRDEQLQLRFVRASSFSLTRLSHVSSFEVWMQETLVEKVALMPGKTPLFTDITLLSVQTLLPSFIMAKLRS